MPKLEHSVIITKGCRVDTRKLPIISSNSNLKYFKSELTEDEIIDLLSDVKHRIFPRHFERLSDTNRFPMLCPVRRSLGDRHIKLILYYV